MTSRSTAVRHVFGGGWAPDYSPSVDTAPDASGRLVIPHLTEAQDCMYELDGGPRKLGGASKVNSVAVESGAVVTGVYDYWKQGTTGAPVRRRVIHAGTKVLADADDAVFASILTGLASGTVPSYFTFDDLLIISSDATDVPKSWDQTTAQSLAGSPPRFSFGCAHKNRAWAAGVYALPSRLYYSANADPEDWAGTGSGFIDIDPNDGDMITGIASHKDELIVFKGPNKGSIHRITGSSPTGGDGFARKNLVKGIGAAWQNAIFPYGDDLGFVSQYGSVHSLAATAAYGDFAEGALSRPLNIWIREHLNYNRLRNIWAVADPLREVVYITMSVDASTTNNCTLLMDYRGAPDLLRWSYSLTYKHASLGLFVDTNGVRRILGGGNDGYVRRLNVADRSMDTSGALSFLVRTPAMNYGDVFKLKTLGGLAIGLRPKGNYNVTARWTRDSETQQSTTILQGGGDVLGPAADHQFTLDTSRLGAGKYLERFDAMEAGDEFRSIEYEFAQSEANQDIEIHSFTTKLKPSGESMENR